MTDENQAVTALPRCNGPSGLHLWSIPETKTGRQTCLWCPAVKYPDGAGAPGRGLPGCAAGTGGRPAGRGRPY